MSANTSADTLAQRATCAAKAELADRIAQLATSDGSHATAIPQLHLMRRDTPTPCIPTVYEPRLCIVAQGSKESTLAGQTYRYDPLNYLVVSVTLPMIGQVIEATPEKPYLSLRLDIDPAVIASLMLDAGPQPTSNRLDPGLYAAKVTTPLLDAVLRLMRLLDTPADLSVLAPLAIREIFYRMLVGDLGHSLREIAAADTRSHRISRAVAHLRQRFLHPLNIDELAQSVHMSTSSLHHQFKAVTTLSPLQFQKQLRLHEARRLMLADGIDAVAAAHRVGYESPSQFSREYKRLFGAPPRLEIGQVRLSARPGG